MRSNNFLLRAHFVRWALPAGILLLFLVRLFIMWAVHGPNPCFYSASGEEIFGSIWQTDYPTIVLGRGSLWLSRLVGMAIGFGSSFTWAPLITNAILGGFSLLVFFAATRRLSGPVVAALACVFAMSIPAFSRMIFSGQRELLGIALISTAYWAAVKGFFESNHKRMVGYHFLSLGALGASGSLRAENSGLLGLVLLFFLIYWRKHLKTAAFLAVWGSCWLWWNLSVITSYAPCLTPYSDDLGMPLWLFTGILPSWLEKSRGAFPDFAPFSILLIGSLFVAFLPKLKHLRIMSVILWVEISAICISGLVPGLADIEYERHFFVSTFLLMAPSAALIYSWFSGGQRNRRTLGFVVLSLFLIVSWITGTKTIFPFKYEPTREVGKRLADLCRTQKIAPDNSVILLEVKAASTWQNIMAYSGVPHRFRFILDGDVCCGDMFDPPWLKINGEEKVGALVVLTPEMEKKFVDRFGAEFLDSVENFKIYRVLGSPGIPPPFRRLAYFDFRFIKTLFLLVFMWFMWLVATSKAKSILSFRSKIAGQARRLLTGCACSWRAGKDAILGLRKGFAAEAAFTAVQCVNGLKAGKTALLNLRDRIRFATERSPKTLVWFGGLTIAFLFFLRLWLVYVVHDASYFYVDSTSQVLYSWWQTGHLLPYGGLGILLSGFLNRMSVFIGSDLFHAPLLVNSVLGALTLALLCRTTSRLLGRPVAMLSVVLALSVPAFSQLIFSGEREILAITLVSIAYVLAERSFRSASDRESIIFDLVTVGVLGVAARVRTEIVALQVLAVGVLFYRWRKNRTFYVLLGLWFAAWLYIDLREVLSHGTRSFILNLGLGRPFSDRIWDIPKWFAGSFFPLSLLLLASLASFFFFSPATFLSGLFWMYLIILWAASGLPLFDSEMDRHACLPTLFLMIPAAVGLLNGFRKLQTAGRRALGVFLLCLLFVSWVRSVAHGPMVAPDIIRSRKLGRQLAKMDKANLLPEGYSILLEVIDQSWPNAVVFFGHPERMRLLASTDVEWGKHAVWSGEDSVGAFAVSTIGGEKNLITRWPDARLVETVEDYRIFVVPVKDRVEEMSAI